MNLEADGSGFCVNIGVLGADPRLHAFSYDVSEMSKNDMKWKIKFNSIHHRIQEVAKTTELNEILSIVVVDAKNTVMSFYFVQSINLFSFLFIVNFTDPFLFSLDL